ncbi:MAG TPA: esterase-like activity of phytase family protein, partial [Chitinophagaceae bacterium]|nr:esterase-like activity of phytase family protein [Chitinophagaceae bacterium]
MKSKWIHFLSSLVLLTICAHNQVNAQISIIQDYKNYHSAPIGTFQGINYREAGFSALYPIEGTNGKEFWTCSDRGVNIDAANANPSACRPTYDKIYSFPNYVPKIHRIRLNGDSIQILRTITMKRPDGTGASGIINPTGYGSTAAELASTDTVMNCANFLSKTVSKDTFGIDAEGLVVDKDGNFWICEEGGPSIWKLNKNGVVINRFTPYANLPEAQSIDILIDTAFKYRKNNRGFEGIAITPNGKIYAMIQSPLLYPTKSIGEATRIHRIIEIDPLTNATNMFVYLNDGIIGASGPNQIRLRDWKIGDMYAINNNEFLVLEAALRGKSNYQRMYKIDISNAT